MPEVTVVIPNLNGEAYLRACLDSLRRQSAGAFPVIVVDNGSTDGSVELLRKEYPEVTLRTLDQNYGFCKAVNIGIRMADTPFVLLLNNDTRCEASFVEELVKTMRREKRCFSCASKMVRMAAPGQMDNGGDLYCALGWAFARGKGKPEGRYRKECRIFSACAGAAIYRRAVFDEIGLFDEAHFAYLEDVDVGYRARIAGYCNYYNPKAVVHHAGSATSGSMYNTFKVRHASRNSVYLVYKNMPWPQIVLNLPFLAAGFFIKTVFFAHRGYLREYAAGLVKGISLCDSNKKVRFQWKRLPYYLRIQGELWINTVRRVLDV